MAENEQAYSGINSSSKKSTIFKEIISYIVIILIAAIIAFCFNKYIIMNANIPSGSMETTIMTNDKVIGNRLSYCFSEPKRGDIIIFPFPDNPEKTYIKRIVGMPGDTLEIKNNAVYINGTEFFESYLPKAPRMDDYPKTVIPDGCYFVLGDNREDSVDSRFWNNPFVERDTIFAKAIVVYYPRFQLLK